MIGSEYASTFAALGTNVWVIDGRDALMPFLDQEISRALTDAMNKKLGIEFLWKNRVVSLPGSRCRRHHA